MRKPLLLLLPAVALLIGVRVHVLATSPTPPAVTFTSTAFSTGATGSSTGILQVGDYNGDGGGDVLVATNIGVVGFKGQFTSGTPNGALGNRQTSTLGFCTSASVISVALGKMTNGGGPILIAYGLSQDSSPVSGVYVPQVFGGFFNTTGSCGQVGGGSPSTLTWLAAGDVSPTGSSSFGYPDNVAVNGGNSLFFAPNGFGGSVLNNFATSATLPSSLTNAAVVALADMNGDGLNDAIVGAGANLVLFPNQNTSTFGSTFTTGTATNVALSNVSDNVKRIAIADVTGDGKADFVALTPTKISIVVGNGAGSLAGNQQTLTLPSGFTGNSIAVADFNGDGFADLAVAAQGTGAASNSVVLMYYGTGLSAGIPQFSGSASSNPDQIQIGSNSAASLTPVDIAAFDMNRDGHPDLVVSTQSDNNVWVLLNNFPSLITTDSKSLQFKGVVGLPNPSAATVTIGTSDHATVPSLLLSTPSSPANPSWVGLSLTGNQLTVTPDVASAPKPGVYRGVATISQDNSVTATTHYARTTITYTVTIVAPSGTLLYKGESGNAQGTVGINPGSMAAGDFNGDGVPDLLAAVSSSNLGIFLRDNVNKLTWTSPSANGQISGGVTSSDFTFPSAAVGDFNLDGKLDAVDVDSQGLVTVGYGDGNGGFAGSSQYALYYGGNTSNPQTLVVADVNGDGYPDILVGLRAASSSQPGGIVILTNDGTGHFSPSLLNSGNSYPSLVVADFNGDGIPDIAASNRTFASSGFTAHFSVDLFLGSGGGVFQTPSHLTFTELAGGLCANCTHPRTATDSSSNLHTLVVGDFNGDGRPDIAFLDNIDSNGTGGAYVIVALASVDGSHNVTFAMPGQKATYGQTFGLFSIRSLVAGDINGDGTADLLFHTVSGTGAALNAALGQGDGTFPQVGLGRSGGSVRELVVADLDGDGRLDAVATNNVSGLSNNAVYMGSKVASTVAFNGMPVSSGSGTNNIIAQGVVTLDPTATPVGGQGVGFHFVPSTAAQVTIKNGITLGSAAVTFDAPASNQTISNVLRGGISTTATVGHNNFVASFPGDLRIAAPATDSPNVTASTLFFNPQPSNTSPNAVMTPSPQVTVTGVTNALVSLSLDHGSFSAGTTSGTPDNFNNVTYGGLKIATAGTYFMLAMTGNDLIKSNSFNITGGLPTQLKFTVGLPANTPAGQVQQVTVQAQDAGGNPANNYTGTVSFSYFGAADPQGTLPNNYTFVSGDNSTKQFNITLKTAGSRSVKVTDIANSSFTDTTSTIVVAGNTSQVTLNSPAAVTIGQAFANLVAHVQDGFGNPISGATVTFASAAGGTGSNGTFTGGATAVTNSSGDATKVITANTSAGTFTVTATANSITSTASTLTINPGAASKLAVQQGSNQSTIVNSQFGTQFQVLATDSGNNPVPGFSVTFTSPSTGASCGYPSPTTTSVNTDNSGLAIVTCTANSITGNYSVTAGGTGVTTVTITNLTNNVGAATNINIQAGNNQSTTVNTNFATNLQVKVVDGSNNPIPGLFIQFTAPASGPSGTFGGVTSTTVGPTASDGTISATTFKANTTAGSYLVTATIGSVPGTNVFTDAVSRNRGRVRANAATGNPQGVALVVAATFNLTNLAGAATTLTKVAGDNQGTTIGTAFGTNLKVNVTDAFSNPVSGASVTFTPPSSGASGTFASFSTVTSDASGNATAPAFTANNTVVGYNVSASASGTNTVTFALTNNAGAPAIMTIVGGNGQHATVTTAFATALQVKVTDAGQNPLTGISVTFTPPSSGASGTLGGSATVTTNSSGIATAPAYTANTIAGGNGLKAVAGSLNQTFNLTNDPGAPVSITPNGTPQTAVINASFGTLSVKVSDSFGNGVSGQSVTFTAPASGVGGTFAGNSKTFTGSTDSSGNLNASAFTANASTGTFTVTAASGALTPTIFTLTNIIVPTAGITVFTGSPQSTQPNTQFQQALVARVFDSQGNPVTTATVTFTLPSSGPSGTFVGGGTTYTTTTNQQGLAFSPLINANGLQGTLSATASTGGFSTTFTLFISLPPAITAAPQVLIFQWEIGTALPKPQGVFVAAPNNQFTFAVDVPWAKVIATPHGTINDSLSVSVDPSNMPPGHYSGTLILSDGGAIVRLDLQVMPKPQINPSAKTISFTYTIGDGIPSEVQDNITAMTRNFNINVTTVYVTQTSVKWLRIVGDGTSTTPALLRVSIVPADLDVGTYSAKIHIEAADATNSPYDITVTLTVQAAPVNPTPPEIVGLVNSATSQVGPISVNEVVSMFGNNLGCVDGPQVLINGNAARILMSTYNQVNFIPPYVPANGKVSVQFLCRGVASNFMSVDLAARVPGIYARQDGLLGDGPMAPGSPLVFYGTGFNGDIQPVVTIGGVRAEILYAGPASDLPGVTQINVRIPADAPAGSVLPIVVTQDGVPAQSGLAVATI